MKIATILAIANNSDHVVLLELRLEGKLIDSVEVALGDCWLEKPLLIPRVDAEVSPELNHLALIQAEREVFLWREDVEILVNTVLEKAGAKPLSFSGPEPEKVLGTQLQVNAEGEGGGWVIGDIIGA